MTFGGMVFRGTQELCVLHRLSHNLQANGPFWFPCSPPSCIVRGDEVSSAGKGQDEQVLDNAYALLQALKEPKVSH